MVYALHGHHRCDAFLARVVAVEFAKRAFGALVVRLDMALEHDLGGRGESKPRELARRHRHRLTEDRADVVVLAHAERHFDA